MAAYVIALGQIHDPERFDTYLEAAMPTLAPHAAEILSIEDSAEVLEGEAPFPRVVLLKFPSKQAALSWKNDPAYQAAAEHRLASSDFVYYLVDEFVPESE